MHPIDEQVHVRMISILVGHYEHLVTLQVERSQYTIGNTLHCYLIYHIARIETQC